MADSRFIFENLGGDIGNEVGCYLEEHDLKSVSLVSTPALGMFQKPLKVAKLLRIVEAADYIAAEQKIVNDPTIIFQHVSFRKRDEMSGELQLIKPEIISPLKLAFKLYDARMWKIFQEKIKDSSEMMKRFYQQAEEQVEHIEIAPLQAAYETYKVKHRLWVNNYLNETDANEAWLELGKGQRLHITKWMLKEYCYQGDFWRNKSFFNHQQHPDKCKVLYKTQNNNNNKIISLYPYKANQGLGFNFTLVRADESYTWALPALTDLSHARYRYAVDLPIFERLFQMRKAEFTKLLSSELEMDVDDSPTFKI